MKILGTGMSERMWEATTKHAKTCELGHKLYLFRGHNFTLFLNPIYQVVQAVIGGRTYTFPELQNIHEVRNFLLGITALHNGLILLTFGISFSGFDLDFLKRPHTCEPMIIP